MTNKKRSFGEHLEALFIVIPGGVGLFIVARTLRAYWDRDWVASAIVCAMGAALLFGLLELLLRQRRASLLHHEIDNLPASPNEATVDAASPLLSALLRARLEQAPLPSLGESVAPFLTGLLVMLGLLGTLLGLFETVHGASLALTSSGDVEALRRSLTTPIEGLTRSFGCSAAGISASAMLGLAVAFVRRREGRVLRALSSYANGPLRVLSPLRKQARALEQLAGQGLALPQASDALEKVGAQLGELSTRLVTLQQTALSAQKESLTELLSSLRGELGKVAADAGSALHGRIAPLVEAAVTRSSEAAREQAEALAKSARGMSDELAASARGISAELTESARALRSELSADAVARRAEAGAWVDTLGARIDGAERARAEAHQAELGALTELSTRTLHRAAERDLALEERWAQLLTNLESRSEHARGEEEARLVRLDAFSERVGGDLQRAASALSAQLGERAESERAHEERARALSDHLHASATALEEGIVRQERALERLVERLPPLFEQVAQASQQGAQESLARLVAATDGHLERVSGLLGSELTRRMDNERAHDERALAALERLTDTSGLLDDSVKRQGESLEALIARVGELLDRSVERHGAGIETLVDHVSGLLDELGAATQQKAEATLLRLAEHADQQAVRFSALSSALESGRAEHALGLEQQLSAHAERLEERLGSASAVVHEAAAIWQASSVEMQAVAELFAKSVERQREASDAWLESLGEVEGAVERAGRHAARDALSDQLASTQEVFARQLQFQRELFEQLRTLRTPTSKNGSHGEHDVSV
ncbi:MAG: hypothetical protein RLZZ450_6789 [Pseudomonadota bacterium]